MSSIIYKVSKYKKENNISSKGALSVVIVITRSIRQEQLPLKSENFITEGQGQVKGLGKGNVQKILNEYGITQVLSEEGGRTSRGSMKIMQDYIKFLNENITNPSDEFLELEKYWIKQIRDFFDAKPFKIILDKSKSLTSIIKSLFEQAEKRQKENSGTMYKGAMMQHLIGAKLEIALPQLTINHNGFSVADTSTERNGDFEVGNSIIHVTVTPSESLIQKCKMNIEKGFRPIIITSERGFYFAHDLAEAAEILDRLDIFVINNFISTNLYEFFSFDTKDQDIELKKLIDKYNEIIENNETDKSLKISY